MRSLVYRCTPILQGDPNASWRAILCSLHSMWNSYCCSQTSMCLSVSPPDPPAWPQRKLFVWQLFRYFSFLDSHKQVFLKEDTLFPRKPPKHHQKKYSQLITNTSSGTRLHNLHGLINWKTIRGSGAACSSLPGSYVHVKFCLCVFLWYANLMHMGVDTNNLEGKTIV